VRGVIVTFEESKRVAIRQALQRHDGNISSAAKELGLARTTLIAMADRFGMRSTDASRLPGARFYVRLRRTATAGFTVGMIPEDAMQPHHLTRLLVRGEAELVLVQERPVEKGQVA
jgi:hypothetical protein